MSNACNLKNLLAFLMLFGVVFQVASQTTYYVNDNSTFGDVYTTAVGNNGNAGTATAPFATITHVINTVGLVSGDTIFIDAGSYIQTDVQLTINVDNVHLIGAGSQLTIFDDNMPGYNENFMKIRADNVTLKGVMVTEYAWTTGSGTGKAIDIRNALGVVLDDVLITNNSDNGDAALCIWSNCDVVFKNSASSCNLNSGSYGGGIDIGSNQETISNTVVRIENSAVSNNSRYAINGGGINIYGTSTVFVYIENSTISDNHAVNGGGIYMSGANLDVRSSCFSNNIGAQASDPVYGGAIGVARGAVINLSNCTFSDNSTSSSGKGGAIGVSSSLSGSGSAVSLTIDSCSFTGNSSGEGADVYGRVGFSNPVSIDIFESSFSGTGLDIRNGNSASISISNSGNPSATGVTKVNTILPSVSPLTFCPDPVGACIPVPCTDPEVSDLSASGTGIICLGDNGVFEITGTPNSTVTYNLGGSDATVLLDGSGLGSVSVSGIVNDTTLTITSVSEGSCTTGSLAIAETITVNKPEVSSLTVPNSGVICLGNDGVFTINGSANGTVTYSLDGGTTTETVVLNGSGVGVVTVSGIINDTTLIISSISEGACTTSGLTDTETITVNKPEVSSLTVPNSGVICLGDDGVFTINGSANGTVTYSLDGGTTTETVVLNGSGVGVVTVSGIINDTTLTISSISEGACTTSGLTDTETITVNKPEVSSLTVPNSGVICLGDNGVFTINGSANGTVTYSLDGGTTTETVVLNGSGVGVVTVSGIINDTTLIISSISEGACTTSGLTDTETITVNKPEVSSLTVPNSGVICLGDDGVFTINGSANGTVTYSLDGGTTTETVVLNGSGVGVVTVSGIINDTTLTISSISEGACTTSGLTDTETITVNKPEVSSLTVPNSGVICLGDDGVFTINGSANGTVTYSLDGGTTTETVVLNGSGVGVVTVSGIINDTILTISSISEGACTTSGLTDTETITVNKPEVSSLTVPNSGVICLGDDGVFTINGSANGTVTYSLDGGTTTETVVLNGSGVGVVTVSGIINDTTLTISSISEGACTTSGLTDTETITVNKPEVSSLTVPNSGVICLGDDGVFTINGSANGTVTYSLDGGTTTETVVLNGSGVGVVTVSGIINDTTLTISSISEGACTTSGLTDTETITVNKPEVSSLTVPNSGVICLGDDGVFTINGSANGTVTYSLDGGTTTETVVLNGSGVGVVTVSGIINDTILTISSISEGACTTSGLTDTETITVNKPEVSSLTVPNSGVICLGDDGVFTINGSANGTVTYSLDGGTTTETVVLNGSGVGVVTVSGIINDTTLTISSISEGACTTSGLTDTETITVNKPEVSSLTVPNSGVICLGDDGVFTINGSANGTVTYSLDGGTTTETVVLNGSGVGVVTVSGIINDTTLTISSISEGACTTSGLTDTETITVNKPEVSSLTVPNSGVICLGNDGVFTINGSANGTVTYSLDGGTTTETVVLNGSGVGVVTVSGIINDTTLTISSISEGACTTNGLTDTETITVNKPEVSSLTVPNSGVICLGDNGVFTINGSANGTVTYSLDGGTTTETVVLNGSGVGVVTVSGIINDTTLTISSISEGACTTSGLSLSDTITVHQLHADVGGVSETICFNSSVQLGNAAVSGITYSWSPSLGLSNASIANPFADPSDTTMYYLTVTQNGCSDVDSIVVNVNALPVIDGNLMAVDSTNCGNNNGGVSGLNVTGAPTLTYSWSDGGSEVGTSLDLINQPSGAYTLTVTDGNSCVNSFGPVGINDIGGPILDTTGLVLVPDTCGRLVGSISGITVLGGAGALSYDWTVNGGSISSDLDLFSVGAGTYILTVSDSAGCNSISGPYVLDEIEGPQIDDALAEILDDHCAQEIGSITNISITGGTGLLTYSWSDGVNSIGDSLDLLNLGAGSYTLLVSDEAGCQSTSSVFDVLNIAGPLLDTTLVDVTIPLCGSSDGSITNVTVSGGVSPYLWSWYADGTIVGSQQDLVNVASNDYSVVVTDAFGCVDSVGVFELDGGFPPVIDLSTVIVTSSSCGIDNGSITGIQLSGGSLPYTITWVYQGVVIGNTLDINQLDSGWYYIEVTEASGCSAMDSVYLDLIVPNVIEANDDFATTEQEVAVQIDPLVNDLGASSITILGGPSNGVATGSVLYVPNTGFFGRDTIVYEICDVLCLNRCDTAQIVIDVTELRPIKIFDGFSPNGDGVNETFIIENIEMYPLNEVVIYSRWGDLVYRAAPYMNEWDGTSKVNGVKLEGNKVVGGTYYFILKLTPESEPINGFIDLRR